MNNRFLSVTCMGLVAVLFGSCCSRYIKGEDYRYNPFQFTLREYFLQPDTIKIAAGDYWMSHGHYDTVRIKNSFVLLDTAWFDRIVFPVMDSSSAVFYKKGQKRFIISFNREQRMGCSDSATRNAEKDFCSSFGSTGEYFLCLFTLTPQDLATEPFYAKGYYWIVHQKGVYFRDVQRIRMYQSGGVTAFRRDFKKNARGTYLSETVIFPDTSSMGYLSIGLISSENEELLIQVINSARIHPQE
ncbi:MAG: hypothetical protein JW795_10765 [Chitinivibrionales bacterium]|nr:hypothetical protein [Chitinivibrionales bacterium]